MGEITECKSLSHPFLQSTTQRVHVPQISRHLSQCSMIGNGYFHKTGGQRRFYCREKNVHKMEDCSQLQLKQTETFIYVTKHVAAHIGRGENLMVLWKG